MTLQQAFNAKVTENGDLAFAKVSEANPLINILFMTEYYSKHLDDHMLWLEPTDKNKLFSMFVRDPRYGLGRRDLGRTLMSNSYVKIPDIVKAGRFDDLFHISYEDTNEWCAMLDYLYREIASGNELAKKWMPRYSSKNMMIARSIAQYWGMNKQQYGKFIKCSGTAEYKLSHKLTDEIQFDKLPSLALLKYWNRFLTKPDTAVRFRKYIDAVKAGKKDMKVSTTTVYDIYRNRDKVDADLLLSKIEKISLSCIPIVDTSGSMWSEDAIGKALSIGHYLATCSTYCPNQFLTFSSRPQLVTIQGSTYNAQLNSINRANWEMNTDFGAVMDRLSLLDSFPEYIVVLSDMEFDWGSSMKKDALKQLWKEKGYTTKIVWWNFNARHTTAPEMDDMGNIFLSGYNPMLLKFLNVKFDAEAFLNKLLEEYKKAIEE